MESVTAFNAELSSLYDAKPPISKAKMASITRAAMKAIKFYKHVVQSVEKFILKCKPEYKIPGLYVIDSIVRQSRHQFGPEKDVFAPRFARNAKQTFANLFRCSPDDKSRIIRVLNLWQKNSVFAPEVIQPLFDLADPNNPIYQMMPSVADMSGTSNGLNTSGDAVTPNVDESHGLSVDLAGNNLSALLKDPNVLRQLQTLQKLKQQEEKQNKLNEMRLQEEAFEKHLQNVLKGNTSGMPPDSQNKDIEFVSTGGGDIEVINLDGNDSRSPTPDRDRYKRRRSRSRSPRGRRRRSSRSRSPSRSRGNSRSPRSNRRRGNSRERDRLKDKEREKEKEKEKEYERERRRKGLPDLKKEHLSVCSTTLWVGHLSKLVQQEELSDTFGKYGDIVSIDMIHPRGCAFIVMNRRQDAHKAMNSLKNHKMQGRAITISWAAGKGVKSKEWKDYWDLDLGVSYIPWNRLSMETDLVALEEGGMFDEDSMPDWIKNQLNQKKGLKEQLTHGGMFGMEGMPPVVDTTQPPPTGAPMMPGVQMVPPFQMGHVPRLLPPMGVPLPGNMVPGMVPGLPMPPNVVPPGMPPPHMLPPGGMMPGFGPMPPMDKSIPPPNAGGPNDQNPNMPPFMANMPMPPHMQHQPPFPNMGMPPQFNPQHQHQQLPPQLQQQPNPMQSGGGGPMSQNDDHMDIEMEDENLMNIPKPPPQMNFNQPPPLFPPGSLNMSGERKMERDDNRDVNRDRNEFSSQRGERGSRWGNERSRSRDRELPPQRVDRNDGMNDGRPPDFNRGRGPPPLDQMNEAGQQMWRDNGPNFQPPNFGENIRRGGPPGPNMLPPIDIQNIPPLQPPDFFANSDFGMDDRRGGGGMNGGQQQRNFFQNPGNRFAPQQMGPGMGRGSPMPMRAGGPAQPPFGPRLGPMFVRGPARPGPPAGFNFENERPPFEREERGPGGGNNAGGPPGGPSGPSGPGGRMRGNNNGMERRPGNWRDEEDNRRGGGGNRFSNNRERGRDRDRDGDRENRDGSRGRDWHDRGSGAGGVGRNERNERTERTNDRKNDRKATPPPPDIVLADTEEDWDRELTEREGTPPAPDLTRMPIKESKSRGDTEDDWDEELSDHKFDENFASSARKQDSVAHLETSEFVESIAVPVEKFENNNEKSAPITSFAEGSKSFDMFAEPVESITRPAETSSHKEEKSQDPVSTETKTTPLYDEPIEAKTTAAS